MDGRQRLKAYAIAAIGVFAAAPALWPPSFHLTDHYIFWTVGHAIVSGRSPYDAATWSEAARRYANVNVDLIVTRGGVVWPYPPWTGFLFAPFGALPLEVGLWTMHASYVVVGIGAAVLLASRLPWRSWPAYALGLLIFPTFQPFIYADRLGHFTSFLLLGAALVALGIERSSPAIFMAGALLLMSKPQVAAIFGLVVAIALIRERRLRVVAPAAIAVAVTAALSIAVNPDALAAMLTGGTDRLTLLAAGSPNPVPTVWAAGSALGAVPSLAIGAALSLLIIGLVIRAVRRAPTGVRERTWLAGTLVVSLAVTPYVFSYDYVLLLPAALIVLAAADARADGLRGLALVVALLVMTVLPWLAFLVGVGLYDHRVSLVVPLVFAAVLAASSPARRGAA